MVRALRVLGHEARVSLQSDRRRFQPYGLNGGGPGQCGRNRVVDAQGGVHAQPGKTTLTLRADETIVVETPGGGGWGALEA